MGDNDHKRVAVALFSGADRAEMAAAADAFA